MLVRPDEKVTIARLLTFLEHGERMAHDCAQAQAALVDDHGSRRFLLSQARQEAAHATVFRGAIAWLAPKHLGDTPLLPALEEYRKLVTDALDRRDLLESFLAEQVILEGLGEAILTRMEVGLAKRHAPFGRLRRILLHQEEAHHGFGRRRLEQAIERGDLDLPTLQHQAQQYLALTEAMVLDLGTLFDSIGEDPTAWARDVRTFLPEWCMA
ncbi:MAG TPA: ferritin-like domain-containing protein [Nitrospira sp.]|nr:ferritin-like domain-containing protein [Nitrospira sp.]